LSADLNIGKSPWCAPHSLRGIQKHSRGKPEHSWGSEHYKTKQTNKLVPSLIVGFEEGKIKSFLFVHNKIICGRER